MRLQEVLVVKLHSHQKLQKRLKQDYRMQMYMGERERERESVWDKIFTVNRNKERMDYAEQVLSIQ